MVQYLVVFISLISKNQVNIHRAIKTSELTILDIPRDNKIGAAILKTLLLGTFITFCSFLVDLFAIFKS